MSKTQQQIQQWLDGEIHHSEIATQEMSDSVRALFMQVVRNDQNERRNGCGSPRASSLLMQQRLMDAVK